MLQEIYKILIMKDILTKPEDTESIKTFINKLKISKSDKQLLINKHCLGIIDKIQSNNLNISQRSFYKLYNKVLIRAYDAMRLCIRYKI